MADLLLRCMSYLHNMNTAYSLLELAVVSQGEDFRKAIQNSAKVAMAAEAAGYTRIWFAEHHNSENIASSATSILIGYAAENTKKIRVGSGGIMLPNHSPLIIAEQFGTLAHLYPGRIDLGLGRAPGTDPATAAAIRSDFFKAAQSFPSEVEKIQEYFSEENKNSPVRVSIAEGTDVPLYILGSSTDSAHLAAAKGLPYAFASHFATTYLEDALEIYRDEFQSSVQLQQPYTMAGINIIIADSKEEAEKLFTSVIKMFIGVISGARAPLQPPGEMTDDLKEILLHPVLQQMLKYSFVGDKRSVKLHVKEFIRKTKVNELIGVFNLYHLSDRINSTRLFAEIMDELNNERDFG